MKSILLMNKKMVMTLTTSKLILLWVKKINKRISMKWWKRANWNILKGLKYLFLTFMMMGWWLELFPTCFFVSLGNNLKEQVTKSDIFKDHSNNFKAHELPGKRAKVLTKSSNRKGEITKIIRQSTDYRW